MGTPAENPKLASSAINNQDRLDAIRLSLVEASLQTPTKVQSTTWMDNRGGLHELSSFKNSLQIQGIKILSYERDAQGEPKARLQLPDAEDRSKVHPVAEARRHVKSFFNFGADKATASPQPAQSQGPAVSSEPGDRLATSSTAPCKGKTSAEELRHVVRFSTQFEGDTHALLGQLAPVLLNEQWLSPQNSKAGPSWKMVPDLSKSVIGKDVTGYERLLLGNVSDQLPWSATLRISSQLLSPQSWGGNMDADITLQVRMVLLLTSKVETGKSFETESQFQLGIDSHNWKRPTLKNESEALLKKQLLQFQEQLNTWLQCEPVQPFVTAIVRQQLKINAGTLAGVRRGDEWLIADPARFPQQLLAKDGAPQTLLARVDAVSAHEAMLTVLAGPTQTVQPQWRAWPLQTVVQETALMAANNATAVKKK